MYFAYMCFTIQQSIKKWNLFLESDHDKYENAFENFQ